MERKKYTDPILLFPNYFKKIGIVLVIAATLFVIVITAFYESSIPFHKDVFKTIASVSFTAGLFFIVMAKEKQEDERTYAIRLQAMSRSFTFVVICALIDQVFSIFDKDSLYHSVPFYILMMMVVYLFSYYSRKTQSE